MQIKPPDAPLQGDEAARIRPRLVQVENFLEVSKTRAAYGVTGHGQTVAVLDTGINEKHRDFGSRILARRDFTKGGGEKGYGDAPDGNGHGTNVAGIIAADGMHTGIAPEANIISLKVISDHDGGNFTWLNNALRWVLANHKMFGISVICMSLGDGENYTSDNLDSIGIASETSGLINELAEARVTTVIAAGNDYHKYKEQGMSFPAILGNCISVGAVYDSNEGSFEYQSGAKAFSTKAGQITPFSQRLHHSQSRWVYTKIFAPGAPITSTGIDGTDTSSTQHGTSQATPVVCGVILLIQQFMMRELGWRSSVQEIRDFLSFGGVTIYDGDDENDNVPHTGQMYKRVDPLGALYEARRSILQ